MEKIGTHFGREVFYIDYFQDHDLSKIDNWICFAISDSSFEEEKFNKFARNCIINGFLEFKAQGKYGEELHNSFDLVMVKMEVDEGHPDIDICTTGDNETDLANAFWECFFASVLPEHANYDDIKILCVNIDGKDCRAELNVLIHKFEEGWLPEND